ncbi:MAG: SAM-dependent methyltransferase [Betaproteobacteria bacterium HGW-Betaproteobacteria-10]|nr:MAG: SAM-dependent methyltransferase [Betaproteobacteria bacterium HGW-Betaproteobacteria-10]
MASLERNLRKDLEKTVKAARRVAEAGARQAVAQLGVGEAEAPKHLTTEQRALRNRLRAHGRQLGDRRDPKGAQATARLVQECAYEQWHRMLFARYLAEADLLIEPETGMAITLDEVQELAREKATDWLPLASDYAERMLPQIFRKDDPVLDIALPPETRSEMEDLLKGLTKPVFDADDSLGWVYQFWQAERKQEINDAEVKIGADELPAVTQLFTEDYMVLFLLHNTLGAWWAGKVLAGNPSLAGAAPDEATLRAACKVGDIDWTYLRFVRDTAEDGTGGPWRPAAGVFEGWPKAAKELTVLDPCMGSGHFLVFALPILVAFRMAEEGLSQSAAVDGVLKDNLFGLEIDPRCTQIAAFNLAFAAWRKVGHRPLPQLNLACSGLAIGVTKAEWLNLAEKAVTAADPGAKRDLLGVEKNLLTHGLEERVKNGLEALYDLFAKAPWLGSLIDPRRAGSDIFREGFDKLEPLLASILIAADTDDAREMAVAAQGMAKAAELLKRQFSLVVTNVPFLGLSKQGGEIKSFIEDQHSDSKSDLATAMLSRSLRLANPAGTVAAVTPQNWLFLSRYKHLRKRLVDNAVFNLVGVLGEHGFESSAAAGAFVALVGLTNRRPQPGNRFLGVDVSEPREAQQKASGLRSSLPLHPSQAAQRKNPDTKILLTAAAVGEPLDSYATVAEGLHTGDYPQFGRQFWEVDGFGDEWSLQQATVDQAGTESGCESILLWERGNGRMVEQVRERLDTENVSAWIKGEAVWGRAGITIGAMRTLKHGRYHGALFTHGAYVIVPNDPSDLAAMWCFIDSGEFLLEARKLDQKVAIARQAIAKVPFDADRWREEAARRFPDSLPEPEANDPTQWLCSGSITSSTRPLQVALARLLGYRWPRQVGMGLPDAPALQSDNLLTFADADGIVCLTALKGEPPAEQRLNTLLAAAFGSAWSAAKLASVLSDEGYAGKSLDDWLRDGFFAQHCELFQQRPFIWHIWDGRRDGFHALVNYHRLAAPNGEGRRTLEKLIYSYLGDWIDRQRADQKADVEGADARVAHAEHLKAELIKILDGEPPYDIFVRWKPLHEQAVGWEPDINDGVRMNIRPFMAARTLNARGANACILRSTPKIKWDKDRGKEPTREKADFPWFWGWDETTADFVGGLAFDGNRWTNLHYSRTVKQAARDRHRVKLEGKK